MGVVIFSTPDCGACQATKLRFDRLGIPHKVVVADDATVDQLRREGFSGFPVVKVDLGDNASWSWSGGYRHDEISKLANLIGV